MTVAVAGSSFSIFGERSAFAGSQYLINARQVAVASSVFDIIKFLTEATVASQYSARATLAASNANSYRTFTNTGRTLFARNTVTDVVTELGFIADGDTTLTDVSLVDGTYEIEVQTSNDYWQLARSKVRFTVQITGGVIEFQGLPNIENLRTVVRADFQTSIRWNIPNVSFGSGYEFGVWSSTTSPVDVSGVPDEVVQAFDGTGAYRVTVTQTEDLFYAVAAFSDTDQATSSEVFQEWDLTAPNAPPDQFSKT